MKTEEPTDSAQWRDVQSNDVRSLWCCLDCKTKVWVEIGAYQHIGTPVCEDCGDDMAYYRTQVRADSIAN